MSFTSKRQKAFPVMVVLSLILTMIACQTEMPMSSEQTNDTNASKVTILKVNDAGLKKVFAAKKLIGSAGGQIIVGSEEDGYSYLSFPQNAISNSEFEPVYTLPVKSLDNNLATTDVLVPSDDTITTSGVTITFYWESESLLQADFYPEGLTFLKPVYVRLSYKTADLEGIDEEKLGIYYYNPSNGNWELISNRVNTDEDYVEGYLDHFSRYAIGME